MQRGPPAGDQEYYTSITAGSSWTVDTFEVGTAACTSTAMSSQPARGELTRLAAARQLHHRSSVTCCCHGLCRTMSGEHLRLHLHQHLLKIHLRRPMHGVLPRSWPASAWPVAAPTCHTFTHAALALPVPHTRR